MKKLETMKKYLSLLCALVLLLALAPAALAASEEGGTRTTAELQDEGYYQFETLEELREILFGALWQGLDVGFGLEDRTAE